MKQLEKDILGAMILNKECSEDAEFKLKEKYFESADAKFLFKIIVELREMRIEPDVTAIYNSVLQKGLKNKIKIDSITEITGAMSAANYRFNSALLVENYLRRLLKQKISETNFDDRQKDVFELYEELTASLNNAVNEIDVESDIVTAFEVYEEVIQEMQNERIGEKEFSLKSRQFPSMNVIGGLRPGNMMAISGKEKNGKTTFALALMCDYCIEQGKRGAIISIEMSNGEIVRKMIAQITRTRYNYLREPDAKNRYGQFRYTEEEFRRTTQVAGRKLVETMLYPIDRVSTDVEVKNKIKFLIQKRGVEVIMIDYIGLIDSTKRYERRDLEIAALSRMFKVIAKEMNCILIILSQENEERKTADGKGLARDADFWISISKPIKSGHEFEKYKDRQGVEHSIKVDNSLFKVVVRASRHSMEGGKFYCSYKPNGEMVELDLMHEEFKESDVI